MQRNKEMKKKKSTWSTHLPRRPPPPPPGGNPDEECKKVILCIRVEKEVEAEASVPGCGGDEDG